VQTNIYIFTVVIHTNTIGKIFFATALYPCRSDGFCSNNGNLELVDIEVVRKLPPDKGLAEGMAFLDDFVARGELADAKAPLAIAITPCPGAAADLNARPELMADVRNFSAAEQSLLSSRTM
jgi:hypothetical protein